MLLVLNAFSVQASLFDRGSGLIYDDVLNLTWLQDANYAKTSGYDDDGSMDWEGANNWATSLVYHDNIRNVDYNDWRLPLHSPQGINGAYNLYLDQWSGIADYGYNISRTSSELSYMYYVNLGLKGKMNTDGSYQPNYGIYGNGSEIVGQNNVGLIKNLQAGAYWTGSAYFQGIDYFYLNTYYGKQDFTNNGYSLSAWAVRDGDIVAIATVPTPDSLLLICSSLLAFAWFRYKNVNP